jgi:hypothetical protein
MDRNKNIRLEPVGKGGSIGQCQVRVVFPGELDFEAHHSKLKGGLLRERQGDVFFGQPAAS